MDCTLATSTVDHIKAEARRLHRAANKREPDAIARVRKLPELRLLPESELVQTLQRRHCLTAVARALGLQGWDQYFIATLGLDPEARDWARIGRDWVRPLDTAARHRLCVEVVRVRLQGQRTG